MFRNIRVAVCSMFLCIMAMGVFAGCSDRAGFSTALPEGESGSSSTTDFQSGTWHISHALSQNEVPMPQVTGAVSSDIADADSGQVLAVWNQYDGSQFNIVASEYRPVSGWDSPLLLSKRQGNSFVPRLKADFKGNAIVVWLTDQGDLGVIHYSKESGWQNEYHLPYRCSDFDLAVSPDNSIFLAMSHWNGQHYIISSLRYLPENGWTEPKLLQTDTSLNAFRVAIAFGSEGDGVAVWEQYDRDITEIGSRKYIWASRFVVRTGWEPAKRIGNQTAGDASSPNIRVDGRGNAVVVWTQLNGDRGLPATTRSNIWFNEYQIGVGWGVDMLLSDNNPGNAYMPTVASNSNGHTIVVWRQSTKWRYGIVHLWFRQFSSDKSWGPSGKVSEDIYWGGDEGYQGRITTTPALVVDNYGNALVLWDFETLEVSNNIASSKYVADSGWTRPNLIDSPDAGYGYAPKVSLNDSGQATAVWCNGAGLVDQPVISIWANRLE